MVNAEPLAVIDESTAAQPATVVAPVSTSVATSASAPATTTTKVVTVTDPALQKQVEELQRQNAELSAENKTLHKHIDYYREEEKERIRRAKAAIPPYISRQGSIVVVVDFCLFDSRSFSYSFLI